MAKKKAKKPKKAKKKAKKAVVPANWTGTPAAKRTWTFEHSDDNDLVASPPNNFTLDPIEFADFDHPMLYQVKSDATHPVTAFWKDLKLAWVPGKQLKMTFSKFNGSEQDDLERRYALIAKKLKLAEDRKDFERLIGLGRLDNADVVVTFFLAEGAVPDGTKAILVAMVDQDVAAPGGAVVGNG